MAHQESTFIITTSATAVKCMLMFFSLSQSDADRLKLAKTSLLSRIVNTALDAGRMHSEKDCTYVVSWCKHDIMD